MNNFRKVINPGKLPNWSGKRFYNVFCEIEYKDGDLSITGVVGPLPSGNAVGGCGQIVDDLLDIQSDKLSDGWSLEMVHNLHKIWDKWHLNDMRPNCQHQTGGEWEGHNLIITTYKLSWDSQWKLQKAVRQVLGDVYNLSSFDGLRKVVTDYPACFEAWVLYEATMLGLMEFKGSPLFDGISEEEYPHLSDIIKRGELVLEVKTETKWSGYVYPSEHPEGILTKQCPECGYKYGTAWLKEEVPQSVLKFLVSLPDTKITPAWV